MVTASNITDEMLLGITVVEDKDSPLFRAAALALFGAFGGSRKAGRRQAVEYLNARSPKAVSP